MIVGPKIRGGVKYHCNRFPDAHRLCDAQPMEWLEFGDVDTLGTEQTRTLRFSESSRHLLLSVVVLTGVN